MEDSHTQKDSRIRYDFPLKSYILKAVQDVSSVFEAEGKKEGFIIDDIYAEVHTHLPDVGRHAIQSIMSKVIANGGFVENIGIESNPHGRGHFTIRRITEKGKKTNWKTMPSETAIIKAHKAAQAVEEKSELKEEKETPPTPMTVEEQIDWAEALLNYVNHLKKQVNLWNIKYSDLERKVETINKEWREVIRGKDKTIATLNQKLTAVQNRITRSNQGKNLLGEIATFKKPRQ